MWLIYAFKNGSWMDTNNNKVVDRHDHSERKTEIARMGGLVGSKDESSGGQSPPKWSSTPVHNVRVDLI